ncbi:hypothetical protein LTSEMIN_2354, partial [Salmonella enterica subsp. enterica serovar Minnesota str. A4-603]
FTESHNNGNCVDFSFHSISDESVETRLKMSIPVNTISSYFHAWNTISSYFHASRVISPPTQIS